MTIPDARFDGTRTVTAVTATTVSFASVNPNLANTNATGTVTYGPTTGGWDYRGGPFIIDSANAATALPIIKAWWAAEQQPAQRPRSAGLVQCRCEYRLTKRTAYCERGYQRGHIARILQRGRHPRFDRDYLDDIVRGRT